MIHFVISALFQWESPVLAVLMHRTALRLSSTSNYSSSKPRRKAWSSTSHSNDRHLLLVSLLNRQEMRTWERLSEAQRKHTRARRENAHPVPKQCCHTANLLPHRKQLFSAQDSNTAHPGMGASTPAGSGRKNQQQAAKTPLLTRREKAAPEN